MQAFIKTLVYTSVRALYSLICLIVSKIRPYKYRILSRPGPLILKVGEVEEIDLQLSSLIVAPVVIKAMRVEFARYPYEEFAVRIGLYEKATGRKIRMGKDMIALKPGHRVDLTMKCELRTLSRVASYRKPSLQIIIVFTHVSARGQDVETASRPIQFVLSGNGRRSRKENRRKTSLIK